MHFPLENDDKPLDRLRVTEGELKADIVAKLDPMFTISVAGVSQWKFSLPFILKHRPDVYIAFDSDAFTKLHVGRHLKSFVEALRAYDIRTFIETWGHRPDSDSPTNFVNGGQHDFQ